MLKPLHRHLIYYKNIEGNIDWNGGHLLSRGAGNEFIQSQRSQGERPCQHDASCRCLEQEASPPAGRRRPQVHLRSLKVFHYFNLGVHAGGTQVSSLKEKKREREKKKNRVLPRVELALMRFSCNYFSAITIRTTTTEDLIRQ